MGKRNNRPTRLSDPRLYPSWIGVGLFWLIGQLPWSVLQAIGRGVGRLAWRLAKKRRHIAETNIRLCFPELSSQEQEDLAHRCVISTGEAILEMAGSYNNHRIDLNKNLTVTGMEHIHGCQAKGQGVLLLGMHFNTLDTCSRMLGSLLDMHAVYRPNDNPVIDRLIDKGRRNYIRSTVDRADLRQMLRLLRNGEVLWYAPDQDYGIAHAVFVPFFGIPAATITATSRIAKMGKAVAFPAFAHFDEKEQKYILQIMPALDNYPSGDAKKDASTLNQALEAMIKQHPEQYMWLMKWYRTRPDGEASFY